MVRFLADRISRLMAERDRVVVAVDGRCASGKSTLADYLSERFGGRVIHADHFFLPTHLRTAERLAEPGGNIHRERFLSEVVTPLKDGEDVNYGVFDCSACEINKYISVPRCHLVIVEGAYSLHPAFGKYYDLPVFMTADTEVRRDRIIKRNGRERAETFFERWMPLEEAYFKAYSIPDVAEIIIENNV